MCEAEVKDIFSNADFYHLRNCIVEVLEEVKLRRNNDAESEERIQQLVHAKYQLERKYEVEHGKMAALEEQHQRHLVDMERNYQDKMRLVEEENKQLKIFRKCGEKETEALKDSVRTLQLAKYSLEKSLREQEHKLQSHLHSSDQQLSEINSLEQKLATMNSQFQTLTATLDSLSKNVSEAVKLNRRLMYVNQHQNCLMKQQKTELHSCQEKLVQLGTQLQSRPTSTGDMEQLQQQQLALQNQIKSQEDQREVLERELDDYRARQKKILDDLQEAQSLVNQHLNNAEQHRARGTELEQTTESLRQKVENSEEVVDKLQHELEVERSLRTEALQEWTTQEKSLKTDLEETKKELTSTEQAKTALEELRVQITDTNVQITQQYEQLKAIVDVEKTTMTQQTAISFFDMSSCEVQTEIVDLATSFTQTVIESAIAAVQTLDPEYKTTSSQTFVQPLTNCSVQTISPETMDKIIQVENQQEHTVHQRGSYPYENDLPEKLMHDNSSSLQVSVCEEGHTTQGEKENHECESSINNNENQKTMFDHIQNENLEVDKTVTKNKENKIIDIHPTVKESKGIHVQFSSDDDVIGESSANSESDENLKSPDLQEVPRDLDVHSKSSINSPSKQHYTNTPSKSDKLYTPSKSLELNPLSKSLELNAPSKSLELKAPSKSHDLNAPSKSCNLIAKQNLCTPKASSKPFQTEAPEIKYAKTIKKIKEQEACVSSKIRPQLPITRHDPKRSFIQDTILKSQRNTTDSPKESRVSPNTTTANISPGVKPLRSRSLYSDQQLLWGAPNSVGEDFQTDSSSVPETTQESSLSETWAALMSSEEQMKASGMRKSPRSRLKMGLKVLTETSPLRPHKLNKPVISGLEITESPSGQRCPSDYPALQRKPQPLSEGPVISRKRMLENRFKVTPVKDSFSENVLSSIETHKQGVNVSDENFSPYYGKRNSTQFKERFHMKSSRGILKSPLTTHRTPKSVSFNKTCLTQVQTFQVTEEMSQCSQDDFQLTVKPAVRPCGEQLLFSDDDSDTASYGTQVTKKRKVSDNQQ